MTKPLQRDAIYLKRHFDAEIADWPTTQGYHGLPRSGYPRWAPRGSAREDCEAAGHCRGRRLKTVVDRIAARKTTFPVVTTTEGYIRGRRGDRVMPLERGITDKHVELRIVADPARST